MKIRLDHPLLPLYLFIVLGALQGVWFYFKWPGGIVIKTLFMLYAAYAFTNAYLIGRKRQRKEKSREEIRNLSDDLPMEDDLTVEDLVWLYEVEELEQIISNLKAMPAGQRKLQSAIDVVEKQSGRTVQTQLNLIPN